MTLVPLINATMPIPLHALAAILALVIGAAQLWLAKGTARHRQLGYVWVGLMAFVAISGFFIYETRLQRNQQSKLREIRAGETKQSFAKMSLQMTMAMINPDGQQLITVKVFRF